MLPFCFGKLPFERKIFLLIVTVTGGALIFFSTLLTSSYILSLRNSMLETLEIVSESVAEQSFTARSSRGVSEPDMDILAIFKNNPDIKAAAIYDTDNVPFLTYLSHDQAADTAFSQNSAKKEGKKILVQNGRMTVQVFHPIQLKGKRLGTLYLLSNCGKLIDGLWRSLAFLGLSFIVSLGGALLAGWRLQKLVLKPFHSLVDSARKVTEQREYALRLQTSTTDEIGDLSADFNLLLDVIENRDVQLQGFQQGVGAGKTGDGGGVTTIVDGELPAFYSNEKRVPLSRIIEDHDYYNSQDPLRDVHLTGKVLLVDDEPISRMLAMAILQRTGLEIEIAKTGSEAVQMIEASEYALILMDIQMPEMNGFLATREIRALEKRSERGRATIIAMSANGKETMQGKCLEAGMDDFVTKPLKAELLLERIVSWLSAGHNESRSSSSPVTPVEGVEKITHNEQEQQLWSRTRALLYVGGDEALFCELATVFIERNDMLLQNIARAIEHGKADDLLESAHAYKGAVGHFASPVLRESALALENLAREGRVNGVDLQFAQLQKKSRLLIDDLSYMVTEAKSG
ncbi:MAG: response regulator [Desulforhopalus sp.]